MTSALPSAASRRRAPAPPAPPVASVAPVPPARLVALVVAVVVAVGIAGLVGGCDSQPEVSASRGVVREGVRERAPTTERHARRRRAGFDGELEDELAAAAAQAAAVAPAEEAPAPEPEVRVDLPGLVRRLFGAPTWCLPPSDAPRPPDVSIGLAVVVDEDGSVTRADVSGGGLDDRARDCLVARAEGLRIPTPIPDAPATVRTTVSLHLPAAPAAPPTPEGPPLAPGARPADTVLPARVDQGRPAGFVAPQTTLPAQAGNGPAAGSVAPDLTLPARGGQGTVWISGSAEARGEVR